MGTTSITPAATHEPRRLASIAVIAASMSLVLVMAAPGEAQAQGELTVAKNVSQVNGAAPPTSDVVSVVPGDTIGYSIGVSGTPDLGGTDVTISDVFDEQVLEFVDASVDSCTQLGPQVTCTVTLDDAAATELILTFAVLEIDACQRLINTVEVVGLEGVTAGAEAQVESCPADGSSTEGEVAGSQGGEGAGDDAGGQAQGSGSPGEGTGSPGQPSTAMPRSNWDPGSMVAYLGVLLISVAAITALLDREARTETAVR